jgi:hypothetical protein
LAARAARRLEGVVGLLQNFLAHDPADACVDVVAEVDVDCDILARAARARDAGEVGRGLVGGGPDLSSCSS